MSEHDVVVACAPASAVAVDDQRLRVGALRFHRRGHQALDRIGDIVRLIEHVGGVEARRAAHGGVDELIEHAEQPKRVDGAGVEIIVAVFRIVEMEAGELARRERAAPRSARY